jgi:hypothetical protein
VIRLQVEEEDGWGRGCWCGVAGGDDVAVGDNVAISFDGVYPYGTAANRRGDGGGMTGM